MALQDRAMGHSIKECVAGYLDLVFQDEVQYTCETAMTLIAATASMLVGDLYAVPEVASAQFLTPSGRIMFNTGSEDVDLEA